ncbi:hypothetical protein GCM10020358_23400 [Amorphoplanes nipponensis]|uniref:Phage integrase family protein n=1 Tax=Actinoplanes nipponensis TaxID=135950 RepID=A0A919JPX2_9ACTN|nr:hypothetical protein [Actinoplanes nipponensis]GIE53175.1 hypothetical protein Ani05nite_67090 [Actinoplanes nipponensis]
MTTALRAPRPRRPIAPDALVLIGQQLRAGDDLASTSRFGDAVWDLSPIIHQAHQRRLILNFPTIPAPLRAAAKELFYTLLAGDLPDGEMRLKVSSIRVLFTQIKRFLDWTGQRGGSTLATLTTDDLIAYQQFLLATDLGPTQRGAHRRAARLFWVYRERLYSDRLAFDPLRLHEWRADNSKPDQLENRTDRIPEQVISPMLVWALRWVDDFSADVLAANAEWLDLLSGSYHRLVAAPQRNTRASTRAALQRLLDDYRAAGRPLPGDGRGGVNEVFLARQIRRNQSSLRYPTARRMIAEARAELSVAADTYLRTTFHAQLNGQPWLTALPFAAGARYGRLLQVACYIVIAYLSGMRDSEVKHLRRGCLTYQRDPDGTVYRRKITSLAFKGESEHAGVTATWIVSAPVERAILVLEQLQGPDATYLFNTLPGSSAYRSNTRASTSSSTNQNLNGFADWINEYCSTHGLPDRIPLVRKARWRLSTSQFRRTLAWFIARRPGGAIAGTIQYRHHSIQMFEGYAGTSDAGFRAEVEAEQTLERGERLLTMTEGHQHHDLRGPAAEEAASRLANFERKVAYAGSVVTDPKRLALIMRRNDPKVYLGKFVTCVHNPDRALCRRQLTTEGPDLNNCQPLRCRNVALTARNLQALVDQLGTLDELLSNADAIAPYVADRLTQQRQDLLTLLSTSGHQPPPENR